MEVTSLKEMVLPEVGSEVFLTVRYPGADTIFALVGKVIDIWPSYGAQRGAIIEVNRSVTSNDNHPWEIPSTDELKGARFLCDGHRDSENWHATAPANQIAAKFWESELDKLRVIPTARVGEEIDVTIEEYTQAVITEVCYEGCVIAELPDGSEIPFEWAQGTWENADSLY